MFILCLWWLKERSAGGSSSKRWTLLVRADEFGQELDRVNARVMAVVQRWRLGFDGARACLGAAALTTQSDDASYLIAGCSLKRRSCGVMLVKEGMPLYRR